MRAPRPVVVIGDALLDVDVDGTVDRLCPDAPAPVLAVTDEQPRPGGAGLAAALIAGRGVPVRLVTALEADEAGERLRGRLDGVLTLVAGPATGGTVVKCRWRAGGRSLLRTDRGAGRPADGFGTAVADALDGALSRLVGLQRGDQPHRYPAAGHERGGQPGAAGPGLLPGHGEDGRGRVGAQAVDGALDVDVEQRVADHDDGPRRPHATTSPSPSWASTSRVLALCSRSGTVVGDSR